MSFLNLDQPETQHAIKKLCLGHCGVYLITNLKNNRGYIGSAVTKKPSQNRLYIRFRNHFFNCHKLFPLSRAVKKYGVHNFSWEILEFTDLQMTRSRETFWIQTLKPEYNILDVAGTSLGFLHTEETRDKMKQNFSEARRLSIKNLNLGKQLSPKIREKLSQRAKTRSPEQEAKHQVASSRFNKSAFSKPTQVLDGDSGRVLGTYSSLRKACRAWNGDYRTFKRCVKSGEKLSKWNIFVKYIL